MTKWKTDQILAECSKLVDAKTQGWSETQLRDKLASLLTAIRPLQATLSGLIDNPGGSHSGMTVTSGLFLDHLDKETDMRDPWGLLYKEGERDFIPVGLKWSEPQPEGIEKIEASFQGGETLHDDTNILSIWQYATACSIFVGSFDASDVRALEKAVNFTADPEASLSEMPQGSGQ